MQLFSNRKREKEELENKIQELDSLAKKLELLQSGNEWARQVLSQITLSSGIPAFDYDLSKFINDGYVNNPNVYAVVNRIIQPAKNVPWIVYKVVNKKEFKKFKAFKAEGKLFEANQYAKKSLEVVEGTDLNKIFEDQPNPMQTWSEFAEMSMGYYALTGNDFIYMLKPSGFKYSTQLYVLPAQATQIIPGDWRQPVKGYKIFLANSEKPIDPENVIHRKHFNPTFNFGIRPEDYLYGLSPLKPLCRTVARNNQGIDYNLGLLKNGVPPGILSFDPTGMEGNPMKDGERKQVEEQWVKNHGGGRRSNIPIVAQIALKWQEMGLKAADIEVLESDKSDVKTIARVYNVPSALVTDDKATYNNISEAKKELWETAIIPALTSLREALNKGVVSQYNLATGQEYWVDFDLSAIPVLQEDKEKQSKIIIGLMEHGMLTGNQGLGMLGLETDPTNEYLNKLMLKSGLRYTDEPLQSTKPTGNEQQETTTE